MCDIWSYIGSVQDEIKEIIAKAQAKGATVILRTPTSGNRDSQLPSYLAKMKEVADEDTSLIYVDQYTEMKQVYTLFPKVFDDFYLDYGVDPLGRNQTMGLHPSANGHIIMTRQFIEGCGLWTDDSHITNLFYEIPFTNEDNATELPLQLAPDKIGVSVKALAEATVRQIGSVKITAADGTKTYTTSTVLGEDETILTGLKGQTAYDVTVTAYLKDTLTTLTFASQRITLSDDMELNFDINLSNTKVRDLKAGAEVGTLSVSKMAPKVHIHMHFVTAMTQHRMTSLQSKIIN